MPNNISCLFIFSTADDGLSNLSMSSFGLAALAAFADAFALGFFASPVSGFGLAGARFFRVGFTAGAFVVSLSGSLVVVVVVCDEKKLLVTDAGSGSRGLGAYCSVARSVMVRAFFFGALPFSGDD